MIFLNGNSDVVTRMLEFVGETSAMISSVFRLSRNDPRVLGDLTQENIAIHVEGGASGRRVLQLEPPME